jgi:hypothetical protein
MQSYTKLGPCVPYLIRPGNTITPGDFDADGRVELASYCANNNSLNVLAYFTYADLDPRWSAATKGQLINAWACIQTVPADTSLANPVAWTLQTGDVYFTAKLAGGNADFLIVFSPSRAMLGVLQWSGQQLQTEFISTQETLAAGVGLNAQDQFIAADVDGDGCDELVMYSPNDCWLFTLKWENGGFSCLARQQNQAGQWTISSSDIYAKACQLPSGADQIAAFNQVNNGALTCLYLTQQNGRYQLAAQIGTAVLPPFAPFANVGMIATGFVFNGAQPDPGLHTLVFYPKQNLASYPPVYMIWAEGEPMWTSFTPDQISVQNISALLPIGFLGKGNDYLFAFDSQNTYVSVFSELGPVWNNNSGPIAPYVGLNANDLFYSADVDGDGEQELVMFSSNDEWLFVLKWNASLNNLDCAISVQTATQSWSVDLLAPYPPNPMFPPVPQTPMAPAAFTGNQLTIYQDASPVLYKAVRPSSPDTCDNIRGVYPSLQATDFAALQKALNTWVQGQPASSDLTAVAAALTNDFIYGYISETFDDDCSADIRAKYLILTYDRMDEFAGWSQQLSSGQIAPLPGSPAAAWSAIVNQLASEFLVVTSLDAWAGADVMGALINQTGMSSLGALARAAGYVNGTYTPNNGDAIDYWVEAIFDAAIWGAAAISGMPAAAPILLALAASLYGSYTAYLGSSNSPGPTQVNYGQAVQDIAVTFQNSNTKLSNQKAQIGTDQVLLPLLGGLFSGASDNDAWTFAQSDLTTLINDGVTPLTIGYYAMLIPERFNILIWQNVNQKEPFYCVVYNVRGYDYYIVTSCGAPGYAYQTVDHGNGSYTIYLLCEGTDLSNLSYPTSDMFDDLNNNLGVATLDVVQGNGPWAKIPQKVLQLPCGSS